MITNEKKTREKPMRNHTGVGRGRGQVWDGRCLSLPARFTGTGDSLRPNTCDCAARKQGLTELATVL